MLSFFMKAALTPIAKAVSVFVKDPNWDSVVLQMNFDGNVGSKYFIDEVGHQVYVRANASIVAVPRFGTGALSLNNDSNSGLEVIGGSEFALGGDFTFETFVYFGSFGLKQIIGQWGIYRTWQVYTDANGYIYFQSPTTGYFGAGAGSIGTLNSYHHIAISRKAGVMHLFVDGVLRMSVNTTEVFPYRSDGRLGIGKVVGQDGYGFVNGYIDSMRLTNGVGRYTENFTPPKLPFVNNRAGVEWDYTVALLKGNGPDGSLVIHDSMSYGDFTAYDGATISTQRSKFGGSSMKFTANTLSCIQSPNRPGYSFGTGDFTIEAQVSFDTLVGGGTAAYSTIVAGLGSSVDGGGGVRWDLTAKPDGAVFFTNSPEGAANGFTMETGPGVMTAGAHFHHVAVCRSNGALMIFVDGIMRPVTKTGGAGTMASSVDSNGPLRLGKLFSTGQNNWSMTGYIDELRIVKGIALYTSNFTPPNREIAMTSGDIRWNHVAFLSHFEGANGTKVVIDEKNKAPTLMGNAAISTVQKRFGESSVYLPGAYTDYVSIPESADTTFYADDFTIEMFVYLDGVQPASTVCIYDQRGNIQFTIAMEAGKTGVWNGVWVFKSPNNFPLNQWTHLAVTRVGNTHYLFENGILVASGVSTNVYGPNGRPTYLGSGGPANNNTQFMKGWLDEVRITRGFARYTKNFTPPAMPFVSSL